MITVYSGNDINNFIGAQSVVGQRGTLPVFNHGGPHFLIDSIFVSKSGNDANPGNFLNPKLTLNGCFSTLPMLMKYVVFLDSGTYNENFYPNFTAAQVPNFIGIYAADGQTPIFSKARGALPGTYGAGNAARVVVGVPNYYVSKAGNNATGTRGNPALPFLTIQGALSNGSRVSADIIEITDSGIYNEDIFFGTLPTTIRAASGQVPTLKAKNASTANGQISWSSNAAIGTVDGLIIDNTGSLNYFYTTTNGSYGNASIIFNNCTFLNNSYFVTKNCGATFTNCLFNKVYNFYNAGLLALINVPQVHALLSISNGNAFTNCFFNGTSQNLTQFGWSVGLFESCTFSNIIITGTVSQGYTVPGCFINNTTMDSCFLYRSSISIVEYQLVQLNDYVGSGFNDFFTITNTTIYAGNAYLNNGNIVGTGVSTKYRLTVSMTNVVIYAYGFSFGLSLQSASGTIIGNPSDTELDIVLKNVVVSGADNNFFITRWLVGYLNMLNCASLAATTTGLTVGGWNVSFMPSNITISGFIDSGSPTAWSTLNYPPVNSKANASVVSSSAGTENCTLAANDSANFGGPQNALGGDTSAGYDASAWDISIGQTVPVPIVINGITFESWSYPGVSPGNIEAGVQSSTGVQVQLQYCTFNETSGTFAVKAMPGCTVENCLFEEIQGHAIASNQNLITLQNNVAVGCAGAFFNNYGQFAVVEHNTAYNCQYGEYDGLQVAGVTSDSNIFSGSGSYDYSGAAELTYSCVGTLDPGTTATLDIHCVQLDPLFQDANGGNVMLQSQQYQYFFNSPCILAASDGNDMGAYLVTYGVAVTTWTLIDFGTTSPDIWYNPDVVERAMKSIKLAEGEQENGALYSVAATYKLAYHFTWREESNPMPISQMEALKVMFKSFTNQVQVNFGDARQWIPSFFAREQGFEYADMTGGYSTPGPQPVKEIVIQEA